MNLMSTLPLDFLLLHHLLLATMAANLITTACNRTLYYDVCITSLLSDSRSRSADLRGLTAISIDLTTVHANNTVCSLKIMKAAVGGSRAKMALNDCLDQYGDAMENLNESAAAFVRADYDTVNIMVSAAMTDADSCSSGFTERKGMAAVPTLLRMMNDYFSKLCSNSLAITALLA